MIETIMSKFLLTYKTLKAIILPLAAIGLEMLMPVFPAYGIVLLAIMVDRSTGISASLKDGKELTSKGLKKTLTKIKDFWWILTMGMGLGLFLKFALEPITGIERIPIITDYPFAMMNIAAFIILEEEWKSTCENIQKVHGFDMWKDTKYIFLIPKLILQHLVSKTKMLFNIK